EVVACGGGLEHEPVQTPQEGGQRLAASGGGEDERRLTSGDGRPSELLWARRLREGAGEPVAGRRVKEIERLCTPHERNCMLRPYNHLARCSLAAPPWRATRGHRG